MQFQHLNQSLLKRKKKHAIVVCLFMKLVFLLYMTLINISACTSSFVYCLCSTSIIFFPSQPLFESYLLMNVNIQTIPRNLLNIIFIHDTVFRTFILIKLASFPSPIYISHSLLAKMHCNEFINYHMPLRKRKIQNFVFQLIIYSTHKSIM